MLAQSQAFAQTLFYGRDNLGFGIGEGDVGDAAVAGEIDRQPSPPLSLTEEDVEGVDGFGIARAGVAHEGVFALLDVELLRQIDQFGAPQDSVIVARGPAADAFVSMCGGF